MASRPSHDTKPHPATLIACWAMLAVILQALPPATLLAADMVLLPVALIAFHGRLVILLRRTRWVMFAVLLVYGYATPGERLWSELGMLSPIQQGLFDGALQLGRLTGMLAGLALLLGLLTRRELLAGIYVLAMPLRIFGKTRERLAVRLALALQYAEEAMVSPGLSLSAITAAPPILGDSESGVIEFPLLPFRLRDVLLLGLGGMLLYMVLWQ